MFVPLAERLSADHRVLAMDWRGHGNSRESDGDFGFAEMVGDALAVISTLRSSPPSPCPYPPPGSRRPATNA
jgi:pimeloyl-ACP methyl ester carboxylesterase